MENYEKTFYQNIINTLSIDDPDDFYKELTNAIRSGKLQIGQKKVKKQLTFDTTWIDAIREDLKSVEKIVRDPRFVMVAEENVTQMERAKKINSRSVQHLASHVQNVQEIREDGTIVPSKILSTTYEDTIVTYENRFVMTLINKLAAFVQARYEAVEKDIKSYESNNVSVKSNFVWRNYSIDADIKFKVTEEITDDVAKKNLEVFESIRELRSFVRSFMNSEFYKTVKDNAKPVVPPILRTNIIVGSVDYNTCLKLWLFLDSYRQLGYELGLMEADVEPTLEREENVASLVAASYGIVANMQSDRGDDYALKPYRYRKIKSSVDNQLLIIDKENQDLSKRVEEPTISEFFYQRIKKNYQDEFVKSAESGISYNKYFATTYKNLLKIENGITDELIESIEENVDENASKRQKKHARIRYLKKRRAILRTICNLREMDLLSLQEKLAFTENELKSYYNPKVKKPSQEVEEIPETQVDINEPIENTIKDRLYAFFNAPRKGKRGKEVKVETPKLEPSVNEANLEETAPRVTPTKEETKPFNRLNNLLRGNKGKRGKEVKIASFKEKAHERKSEKVTPEPSETSLPPSQEKKNYSNLLRGNKGARGKEVKIESKNPILDQKENEIINDPQDNVNVYLDEKNTSIKLIQETNENTIQEKHLYANLLRGNKGRRGKEVKINKKND